MKVLEWQVWRARGETRIYVVDIVACRAMTARRKYTRGSFRQRLSKNVPAVTYACNNTGTVGNSIFYSARQWGYKDNCSHVEAGSNFSTMAQ
jgi:adenine-specific DNA methylase